MLNVRCSAFDVRCSIFYYFRQLVFTSALLIIFIDHLPPQNRLQHPDVFDVALRTLHIICVDNDKIGQFSGTDGPFDAWWVIWTPVWCMDEGDEVWRINNKGSEYDG